MGMSGEETAGEPDLVTEKEPETQTEQTRSSHEALIEPRESGACKRKRQSERGGDEHHSGDGAGAENQQIENRPVRIANRAQYQQSHCGRTSQSVDDANEQRAQGMKKSEPLKRSA